MNQYIGMIEFNTPLLCIGAVFLILFILAYLYARIHVRRLRHRLLEKYALIYRVVSTPSGDQFALKAEGTAIEVGDYGWEAEPIYQDGLIYLHGLNSRWQVVWYAGFRPDQVEVVNQKPQSHYYVFPDYMSVEPVKVPQCPFPVSKYKLGKYPDCHLGFPKEIKRLRHGDYDWVQGKSVPKRK